MWKKISNEEAKCPECGCPLRNGEGYTFHAEDNIDKSNVKKRSSMTIKIIGVLIGAAIVIAIIAGVGISARNAKIREQQETERSTIMTYNVYIDTLNSLYSDSYNGAANAESVCVLTANVWTNSIYGKSSEETDKYTAGTSDFNAAVQKVYEDEEIKKKLTEVQETQIKCNDYIQTFQSCPEELDKCYDAAVQLNTSYTALAELALSPAGTLTSYKESESQKVEAYKNAYNTLGVLIPDKKEVPLYDSKGNKIKDEFAFEIYLNQNPDKLPDTVDGTMANLGLGVYRDVAEVCGEKGDLNYNAASGVIDYISWSLESPSDTFKDKLLENLRERYGEESKKEDNLYSWHDEEAKNSLMLKVESDKVSVSWFNIK